ncbi:YheC/YheD family protein [Paenibacillus sambharensis]|uniref:YheC/YheD family protein n=1 Tax=Paenibacillus sambharensis TaxID=1803190 RepID=A0A2W1LYQ4_9BACL|nr:YheC/YheD family protein [Paenibacillus sambharensis]PZD96637.1 YheC/YheD family protein [Paenibacillus sambharensis]
MAVQRVKSKLAKTKVLEQHCYIRDFIPLTRELSKVSLNEMLTQHSMVYIKPDIGSFGNGVMRIEQQPDGLYRLQLQSDIYSYSSFDRLYEGIRKLAGHKKYLVQRGIELLRYNDRRFDLRVMVQKNPKGKWETTGIIGRLAHPAKAVTNYHSGGTPLSFEQLTQAILTDEERQALTQRLKLIGAAAASGLQSAYPRLKELGLDIAIDTDKRPWLLEVNTLPDPWLFRKHDDPAVFRKIYHYAAAYGRFKHSRRSKRARQLRSSGHAHKTQKPSP